MAIQPKEIRIKPFLRWAGGKTWLIDTIHRLVDNRDFTSYYEPFLGGGSIFFSLSISEGDATISDANKELIETYVAVRDNPYEIIKYLSTYECSKDFYYELRAKTPTKKYEKAARFIFLNHTSFNGLYRVNKQGKYNVPYGQNDNVVIDTQKIKDASKALKKVNIIFGDFDNRQENIIKEGSLVFLDPPYTVSHNNNGFIEYNKNIFSLDDQRRLAKYIEYIKNKGAYFILTNAAHESIKEIFGNCGNLLTVKRQSLIGGKNAKRGLTEEYIFTNLDSKEK